MSHLHSDAYLALVVGALAVAGACQKRDLRGQAQPSPDGKTYLVVDVGKGCPLELDGRPWTAGRGRRWPCRLVPTRSSAGARDQAREAANETSATITASRDIPYDVVIGTVDAIRKAEDGREIFPDITFGVPR